MDSRRKFPSPAGDGVHEQKPIAFLTQHNREGVVALNYQEAMAELRAGTIRPIYLIYGGESLLEDEICRAIKAAVVQPETADFNYHQVDPGPDQVARAIGLAQTQPFFADRRLVVVRDAPVFLAARRGADSEEEEAETASGADDTVVAYARNPAPSTCLVFWSRGGVDSRRKVTKALIATGGVVDCKPLRDADALMWTQDRSRRYGKKLGDNAARLLLEKTARILDDNKLGADLTLIDSELQKLALYAGDAPEIKTADVDAVAGGIAETEIFRLTEAVMLKQRAKAVALLGQTLRQVDHPLQVLVALTNRFRQMLAVKALVARGTPIREGPGIAKMHPFAYEKMVGHVRPYDRSELAGAMEKLLEADLAIKSGAEPRLTLETLVIELMA